jgi:hypothetical protein
MSFLLNKSIFGLNCIHLKTDFGFVRGGTIVILTTLVQLSKKVANSCHQYAYLPDSATDLHNNSIVHTATDVPGGTTVPNRK